jgi:hypothetical protein
MWANKWNLVIRGIEGEKDRIERPRETGVSQNLPEEGSFVR